MGRRFTPVIGGVLCALLSAGCSDRVIASGMYTCEDDSDCTWGWRCLPTSSGAMGCVDPSVDAGLPPDNDALAEQLPLPSCGNGRLEGTEECDAWMLNSLLPDAPCRPDCSKPRCGDQVKDSGEDCDGSAGCDAACRLTRPSRLVAAPGAVHFGAVGPGCEGPQVRTVELYNSASFAVVLAERTFELDSGCSDEFTLGPQPAGSIDPGASVAQQIIFTPTTEGLKSCALLVHAGDGELVVALTAAVGPAQRQTDLFWQHADHRVDILFAIDPSGSMMDERVRLMDTAAAFAQIASSTKLDFHLGAISIVEPSSSDELLGALFGDPRYMTSQSKALEAEYKTRIDLPSGGGVERGFDAILAALSPALAATVDHTGCAGCRAPYICMAGACRAQNYGFRRTGASLEILVMSDEDDGSEASAQEVLAHASADVNPLLGHLVRVHGLLPESEETCEQSWMSGPTPRWDTLIEATSGERHDVCAQSFVPAIQTISNGLFGLRRQFPLTRLPVASSVEVSVDGKLSPAAFYQPDSRSVILPTAPAEGSQISIEYQVSCASVP